MTAFCSVKNSDKKKRVPSVLVLFLWYHNDSGQRIQDTLRLFWEKVGAQQCLGWDDMPIRHELT